MLLAMALTANLDPDLLLVFVLVAEERSFTRAAERLGQLPAALARLVEENRAAIQRQMPFPTLTLPYLVAMLSAVGGIVSLTAVFVMPKFKSIFHDFGVPMPPAFSAPP